MIPSQRRPGWQYWEVADLLRDGTLEIGDGYRAKNSEMGRSGLPFARAGNLNEGFHFEEADILSEESVWLAGEKISKPGDITFTSKGTFGRFAIVREDTTQFVYSPQLCYWRVKREGVIDRTFLYYWIQGADSMRQLNEVKGLTDMADYVSLTNQRKMWLSAPPLPLQRKISAILSAYDELIKNGRRRIRILEEMARALYREWFVRFRFPGHEKIKRVDSAIGQIPQSWDVKHLGEIATITMGLSPNGDTYNEVGDGTPLVNGPVEFAERFTKQVKWTTAPTKLCREGDLVVCVRGSTTGKYVKSDGVYCLGRGVCGLSSQYQCFVDLLFANELPILLAQTSGSTFPSWTGPQLKFHPVLSPPPELLARFEAMVQPLSAAVLGYSRRIQNLRRTRDLLLPRLLSGQVDLKTD
ncbi:MAG: restriction endonuclease subunit S [Terriglobia bacterium]